MDTATGITPVMPIGNDGLFGGGGGNAFLYIFGLLILLGLFNGGFGFGGNRSMPDVATKDFVTSAIDNQATQTGLRDILLSSANNNYEVAQRINDQTTQMLSQNNANLINAIQGFNQLGSKIDNLGYHMDQCCCEIKTQMLQNRLDDAQAALVTAQGAISNANQSQYLLSMLGSYTPGTV